MFGDDICCDSSMFLAEGWVVPAIVGNLERMRGFSRKMVLVFGNGIVWPHGTFEGMESDGRASLGGERVMGEL